MSSDHFQHHVPHFHPIAHTYGFAIHTDTAGPDIPLAASGSEAPHTITALANSAGNLSPALTGHYQSLIEGHPFSIKPAEAAHPIPIG